MPKANGLAQTCEVCGGLWLDPKALKGMGASLPTALRQVEVADPRTCPGCEVEMGRMVVPEVEIDLCNGCHGIWLDAGELATLRGLRQHHQGRALAAMASEPAVSLSSSLDAVDAINLLEFIFDVAGFIFDLLAVF